MSKFKKALKAVAGLVNDIVPNEIKPIVKVGLALIPGVGPALSAAYTAADAYGGGASLGNSLGQGAKSFAISQVAGAASRSLGLTTAGNDLTDALGQTSGQGTFGSFDTLGAGSSQAAQTLGTTVQAAPVTAVTSADLPAAAATAAPAAADAVAPASSSLFSFNNLAKGAAIAGGVATAASMLTKPAMPTMPVMNASASNDNAAQISDNAAVAAAEEERRKRRGGSSNIYTSPLGLGNGQSAAAQLLG